MHCMTSLHTARTAYRRGQPTGLLPLNGIAHLALVTLAQGLQLVRFRGAQRPECPGDHLQLVLLQPEGGDQAAQFEVAGRVVRRGNGHVVL